MNLQTISEHTFDADLLPEKANILDAGCGHDLIFTKYFFDKGHNVLPLDIQDLGPENKDNYLRMGLYFHSGKATVTDDQDQQARRITDVRLFEKGKPIPPLQENEVYLANIESCAIEMKIEKFDLVKLDIEGAEIVVLQNAKHPIAKQLSVEFHAHTGQSKEFLDHLLKWLSQWYDIHGAVWEERHGCSANYWDVLFIAK